MRGNSNKKIKLHNQSNSTFKQGLFHEQEELLLLFLSFCTACFGPLDAFFHNLLCQATKHSSGKQWFAQHIFI